MIWSWHLEPPLIAGLLATALGYFVMVGPLRAHHAPAKSFPKTHSLYFVLGLVALYLALGSPLDLLGSTFLFSAHMAQHMLLIYLVPPLLLNGIPPWLLYPLLRGARLFWLARLLTKPVIALVVFNVVLVFWHMPAFYEATLTSRLVHNLEHLSFLLAGILMWWPLLSPTPQLRRLHHGGQLIYIFGLSVTQLPIVGFITFSPSLLYPSYALAPRVFDISPLADQQLGGVIMSLCGMIVLTTVFTVVFFRWYQVSEARARLPARQTARQVEV
jgi:putative membrane protein